jgi:hypothetical protein
MAMNPICSVLAMVLFVGLLDLYAKRRRLEAPTGSLACDDRLFS